MPKALIFGISGQDGSLLAKFLLDRGYEVIGTSRDAEVSYFGNLRKLGIRDSIRLESVSLNDFRSVISVLNKYGPDEIYNLAGQSSVGLSFAQPVETFESIGIGTLNLLEAIRFLSLPARFYNAGSSECFGNTDGKPATEDMPLRPRSPYAVAKATAFWQVANYREAYDLFACSGFLFNHESPLRPLRFVTRKIVHSACRIKLGLDKTLALGNLCIKRDWGWAPEYIEAMWAMLQIERPDDFIIATGESNSLESFVQTAFTCLDLDWRKFVTTDESFLRPTEIMSSVGDSSKAESILGWKARFRMRDVVKLMVEAEMQTLTNNLQS